MNLPTLLANLEVALDSLAARDFVALVNGHSLHSCGDPGRILTFTSIPEKDQYPRKRFSRIEEYLYALKWAEYSAILYDGSVIQIEYRDRDHRIWWHRLCYHPCPVDMDLSDRNALDVPLDEAVLQSLAAGNPEVIRPFASLRFDYNADFSSDTHPISHFSMLSADCRIPVRAPLGLHKFLYFIFHNFYANDRDKWSSVIEPLHFDLQDSILDAETKQMHIGWR